MKRGKKEKSGKRIVKALALSQIFIFIISSFAFAFILGGGVVSAAADYSQLSQTYKAGSEFIFDGKKYLATKDITFTYDDTINGDFDIKLANAIKTNGLSPLSATTVTIDSTSLKTESTSALTPAPPTAPTKLTAQDPPKTPVIPARAPDVSIAQELTDQDIKNIRDAQLLVQNGVDVGTESEFSADITASLKKAGINPDAEGNGYKTSTIKNIDATKLKSSSGASGTSLVTAEDAQFLKDNPNSKIPPATTPSTERKYTTLFGKESTYNVGEWGALTANLGEGLKWSLIIIGVVETLGKTFLSEKNFAMVRAGEQAAVAGIMSYKSIYGLFQKFGTTADTAGKIGAEKSYGWFTGGQWAMGAGILVAYLAFASQYKKEKTTEASIEFKCMPWQAPSGGSDCNKCNGNALQPCSEYRCKSLGQTCMLINKGTGQDRCIDSSPNDVTSPGIKPDTTVLTNGYKYTDRQDRPPGGEGPAHVRITSTSGGCLKAFTAFEFGIITTDIGDVTQPAQCKLDYNHTTNFNAMNYYMNDDNLFIENHSQAISLPGTDLLNKTFPGVKNDGEYTLYVRCKDGNGNENRDEYAVRFCIDKTPDLSSPIISSISIPSGSPVLYGVDNLSIGVYTNEPANCRWSRKDASYLNMENQMTCSNNVWEMNAELLYTCNARLTGIKDKEENNFYFRCTDLSNNTMQQSYNYKLIGTQPINILSVGPSGTIGSSTSTATVSLTASTDNGYKNGESICYYSQTNLDKDYVAMFETGGNTHKQTLDLVGGNYKYYFKCVDAGGNTAHNNTNFTVFVDKFAPAIVRAYLLENKLIVTTDEDSTCSYSTTSCNFNINEGVNMPIDSTMNHYADWKTEQTYYVKCKDKFNNEPDPTQCSMAIQPYSLVDLTA